MLVVLSDTHRSAGHGLGDHLRATVADADRVVHAGDFTSTATLEAFHDVAPRLDAVHGNADGAGVRDRLPAERTLTYGGVQIAVTHTRAGGETGLAMFGRQAGASLVVSGHTHRQHVGGEAPVLLNPGSHDDPRGNRPGYAVLEPAAEGLRGECRGLDGTVRETFAVSPLVE